MLQVSNCMLFVCLSVTCYMWYCEVYCLRLRLIADAINDACMNACVRHSDWCVLSHTECRSCSECLSDNAESHILMHAIRSQQWLCNYMNYVYLFAYYLSIYLAVVLFEYTQTHALVIISKMPTSSSYSFHYCVVVVLVCCTLACALLVLYIVHIWIQLEWVILFSCVYISIFISNNTSFYLIFFFFAFPSINIAR